MKKNLLAITFALSLICHLSSFSQSGLEGSWNVQNISCTHSGKTTSDPYHAMFYENWKNQIPVKFTKDSVMYQKAGSTVIASYLVTQNNITFRFYSGKAGRTGGEEPAKTVATTSTYEIEAISQGYRLLLTTGEDLSIIELIRN